MSARNSNGKRLNERVQKHPDGTKEYWRDISGWEGYYRVSDQGRVKSLSRTVLCKNGTKRRIKGRIRKPEKCSKYNHYIIGLHKDCGRGNGRQFPLIHHLVLKTFVGACPPGKECRHLDGDATNNKLDNLIWGTRQENEKDKIRHGKSGRGGSNKGGTKVLSKEMAREIRRLYKPRLFPPSKLSELFGVSASTIRNIIRGKIQYVK